MKSRVLASSLFLRLPAAFNHRKLLPSMEGGKGRELSGIHILCLAVEDALSEVRTRTNDKDLAIDAPTSRFSWCACALRIKWTDQFLFLFSFFFPFAGN